MADQRGAASGEYVLIDVVVGTGFAAGAWYPGQRISDAMQARGNGLQACADGTSPGSC